MRSALQIVGCLSLGLLIAGLSACGGRTPLTLPGDGSADGGAGAAVDLPVGQAADQGVDPIDVIVAQDAAPVGPDLVTGAPDTPPGAPGPIQVDDNAGCKGTGGPSSSLCQKNLPCPVALDVTIDCIGSIDSVRVAAGAGHAGYVSYATVPGTRSNRLVTIDPDGASGIETPSIPMGEETIYVLANEVGQPSLVAEYPVVFALAEPGNWIWQPVPPMDGMSLYFGGAIAPTGDIFILHSAAMDTLVLSTFSGNTWTQSNLGSGLNGGVAGDGTGQPLVAYWDTSSSPPLLRLVYGATNDILMEGAPPDAQLSLRINVAPVPGGAVTSAVSQAGPTVFLSTASVSTSFAPPTPPPLPSGDCPSPIPDGSMCPAMPTCTQRSANIVEESLGVAATSDGRVWATYLWQQTDQDYSITPPTMPCHDGPCRCQAMVTADRSTVTLIVAEVPLDGSPLRTAWSAVVGGPLGASSESTATRSKRLLLPITLGGTSIRYLDLDTGRL
jgi:hypothetical protein